jgi:hypothetical protein
MSTLSLTQRKTGLYALFNIVSLAIIYFVPTISHLVGLPLYLIEPMRLMLVLALVHTNKYNAYIIALTLPLFSYLISAHPHFPKMMLITAELLFNVWFFYFIFNRTGKAFASIISSIIISKAAYYAIKFGLISLVILPSSKLISTPIYIQIITTLVFSAYLALLFKRKEL